MALEEDAYDIAALLHKEFSYLMRDNSNEDNRQIVSLCVSSINKEGGMIDEKTYLLRVFMENF